ncbi:Phototropin-2 [Abeliophyllum distichum]|uniref:non-specific serine/threonine protein kinase n=1 Tax=Abeliophyllum distichum TaxID=126358 RepID=A0ABD1NTJ3_9LAMI
MESSIAANRDERLSTEVFESAGSGDVGMSSVSRNDNNDVKVLERQGGPSTTSTRNKEAVNKWMAFEAEPSETKIIAASDESSIAQRTAEWGLKIGADVGDGVFRMNSKYSLGEGERSKNSSERFGAGSTRTSEDSNIGTEFPRVSQELKDALATLQQTFVVSDATKPDCPIVYASSGFFTMTGYSSKEVIGRNWALIQTRMRWIRFGMQQKLGTAIVGRLLNYKKDGTPFWNLLTVTPVKDSNGRTIKFIGMQVEVSKYTEGVNEKALRPNGLPKSLIRYDARQKEKAIGSMKEVVQTVKHPRSHMKSLSHDTTAKNENDKLNLDYMLPGPAEKENTDPRLPDNPIIFASDSFLELTEYTREEILGKNCRFLQGPETDQATVSKIRDAIRQQREITVQLINYTKSGKKFWNLFHLQPMRDQKGELQYFIGVQLDGSDHVEPLRNRLSENAEQQSAKLVKATAENVDEAIRELPDANLTPEDLWALHSQPVFPRPHKRDSASWAAIRKITVAGKKIGLHHFKPVRPLGCGDTGSVHLVELKGTGLLFAMKAMDKSIMLNRNKVHRACIEREIISLLDHPFLPTLYTSFQTPTHVCLITDFCPGGELFAVLDKQPMKIFKEESARFYAAEVVIGLEYLHCLGIIYRDLKPENILLQKDGHVVLTDFDLSFKTACEPQVLRHPPPKNRRSRSQPPPVFIAEPNTQSNSFVGTEEYIAPEIITGEGHSSAIDWWALGILLYEMLYGRTPFRGKNRQKTFANILHKDLTFPSSIPATLAARQLINALLSRDPASRLGSNGGANEIKQHPFFRGINWPLIRCMSPPPLDVPLQLIGKEESTKDVNWDDEGVLVHPMELF